MLTILAVSALVLAYLALVAAYVALRTLARLRRASSTLSRGGPRRESVIEATERHIALTTRLADEVRSLRTDLDTTVVAMSEARDAALRKIALVRYDAFTDMAGRMSFSLALLDEHGDGVALTAIAGHTDTRLYAKGVTGGKGEHELSPEERQAVRAAVEGGTSSRLRRKAG